MSVGIICRQKPSCRNWAAYRYTWAGQDESYICEEHAQKLKHVAMAMGYHCQLIPLTTEDHHGKEGMKSLEEQQK